MDSTRRLGCRFGRATVRLLSLLASRLLSLRILVDFEDRPLWRGWGFWILIVSMLLINVWSAYGIFITWNYNGTGPDAASWTAWAIVNMQTMQLIFVYMRLHG